jgi:hypothetical protein
MVQEMSVLSNHCNVMLLCDKVQNTYAHKHLCAQTHREREPHDMSTIRWNIAVSPNTDQSVRMFLASQGGGRKGDLSRFIEEAVRTYLFERAVKEAKNATSSMSEIELDELIDEAVQWAHEH